LLEENDLDYVGMVTETKANIAMQNELGQLQDSLENWQQVEEKHNSIFDGMYQFYCQKLEARS